MLCPPGLVAECSENSAGANAGPLGTHRLRSHTVPLSRRPVTAGPTPLGEIAQQTGLILATRSWLERTVANVAFDGFIFGQDVLCNEPDEGADRGALERGWRADGVTLAVGSLPWRPMPVTWIAVQSKRGANHLDLDRIADASGSDSGSRLVGHERFDETFDLDADDDGMDRVWELLTDEVCDWAVAADEQYGPLTVVFDGAEPKSHDALEHGATVYVAREVDNNDAFVNTLAVTVELVSQLRHATET